MRAASRPRWLVPARHARGWRLGDRCCLLGPSGPGTVRGPLDGGGAGRPPSRGRRSDHAPRSGAVRALEYQFGGGEARVIGNSRRALRSLETRRSIRTNEGRSWRCLAAERPERRGGRRGCRRGSSPRMIRETHSGGAAVQDSRLFVVGSRLHRLAPASSRVAGGWAEGPRRCGRRQGADGPPGPDRGPPSAIDSRGPLHKQSHSLALWWDASSARGAST